MTHRLDFTAVSEDRPGPKWAARWESSWPAYEAWFVARGGDAGPPREVCEAALKRYMPELLAIYARLAHLAGNGDRAARFLSGWRPPAYLGGCTLAAHASRGEVRLVRNYDLSPDLNEGLLLRSAWRRPVMGMVEFLWGLSDGMNDVGLCVALAYGGRETVKPGFGVTTIVRYLLETSDTVDEALRRLAHAPSHMAYNLVLADATGDTASVELLPGGGMRRVPSPIATNHQSGPEVAERARFTRTLERRSAIEGILSRNPAPADLHRSFLIEPLFQDDYANGFGTLFTADYDPVRRSMALHWPSESWAQSLFAFEEGSRRIAFDNPVTMAGASGGACDSWSKWAPPDGHWAAWGMELARRYGAASDFGGRV